MAGGDDFLQASLIGGNRLDGVLSLEGLDQPWLRLPGESAKWYSRFEIYASLGPERSISLAYQKVRQVRKEAAEVNRYEPPTVDAYGSWHKVARLWCWKPRAEAWDEHNRQNILRRNEQRRIEERETRIKIITQHLHIVDVAMLAAELDTLNVEQARNLLPTLRLLLRDMLDLHRTNLEPLPIFDDNHYDQDLVPFTADELGATVKELGENDWWGLGREGDRANKTK
jgi:hypothetical protein